MFDIWKVFFPHIVLSAGSTMFPGFADRVQKTITELVPNNTTVNIIAPPERKYSTWIGDTMLPSFADRLQKEITGLSSTESASRLKLLLLCSRISCKSFHLLANMQMKVL